MKDDIFYAGLLPWDILGRIKVTSLKLSKQWEEKRHAPWNLKRTSLQYSVLCLNWLCIFFFLLWIGDNFPEVLIGQTLFTQNSFTKSVELVLENGIPWKLPLFWIRSLKYFSWFQAVSFLLSTLTHHHDKAFACLHSQPPARFRELWAVLCKAGVYFPNSLH